jgi:hypothetical protein
MIVNKARSKQDVGQIIFEKKYLCEVRDDANFKKDDGRKSSSAYYKELEIVKYSADANCSLYNSKQKTKGGNCSKKEGE